MAQLFAEEKQKAENRERMNLVFLAYPYSPALPADEYRRVMRELQDELPVRLWYFLDEVTTAELMRKIWRAVLRADLSFFDTSNGNPNVAFELGLAAGNGKRCVPLLKSGSTNPLGTADLGYAERAEYDSAGTLKTKVAQILHSRCSGLRAVRATCQTVALGNSGFSRDDLYARALDVLNVVFSEKRVAMSDVRALVGDETVSTALMQRLRAHGIVDLEGKNRGARWVFAQHWVHKDHEVAGL